MFRAPIPGLHRPVNVRPSFEFGEFDDDSGTKTACFVPRSSFYGNPGTKPY